MSIKFGSDARWAFGTGLMVTAAGWLLSWLTSRGQDVSMLLIPGWILLYIATGGVHDLNFFGKFLFKNEAVLIAATSLFNLILYALAAFMVIRAVRSSKIRRQNEPRRGDI